MRSRRSSGDVEQGAPGRAGSAEPRRAAGSGEGAGSGPSARLRSKLVEEGIGSGPARLQTEAEAKAFGEPQCPKFVGQQSTAAQLVGRHGRPLQHQDGWAWQHEQGILVFAPRPGDPLERIPAGGIPKGIVAFDDAAFYVPHCQPSGCGPHGTGVVIDRVDRSTSKATQLVPPQSEIAIAQVLGEYLYWTTFGPYGRRSHRRAVINDAARQRARKRYNRSS